MALLLWLILIVLIKGFDLWSKNGSFGDFIIIFGGMAWALFFDAVLLGSHLKE